MFILYFVIDSRSSANGGPFQTLGTGIAQHNGHACYSITSSKSAVCGMVSIYVNIILLSILLTPISDLKPYKHVTLKNTTQQHIHQSVASVAQIFRRFHLLVSIQPATTRVVGMDALQELKSGSQVGGTEATKSAENAPMQNPEVLLV